MSYRHFENEGDRKLFEAAVSHSFASRLRGDWKQVFVPIDFSEEELEAAVRRKVQSLKTSFSDETRSQLESYVARWKVIFSGASNSSAAEILNDTVAELYGYYGETTAPPVILCDNPFELVDFPNSHLGILPEGPGNNMTQDVEIEMLGLFRPIDDEMKRSLTEDVYRYLRFGLEIEFSHYFNFFNREFFEKVMQHNMRSGVWDNWKIILPGMPNTNPFVFCWNTSMIGFGKIGRAYYPESFISCGFVQEFLSDECHIDESIGTTLKLWLRLFELSPWISMYENICFAGIYPKQCNVNSKS